MKQETIVRLDPETFEKIYEAASTNRDPFLYHSPELSTEGFMNLILFTGESGEGHIILVRVDHD